MSDPLIHDCENFVVLEPGKAEKILTAHETKNWLICWLEKLERLPVDLQNQKSIESAAERLMDTACSLEMEPGFTLQWYAVRIRPPEN
tara:strand:+ start:333 stop:596 length:264 start_codon:yes stop_codon:yes gene_type:complete